MIHRYSVRGGVPWQCVKAANDKPNFEKIKEADH